MLSWLDDNIRESAVRSGRNQRYVFGVAEQDVLAGQGGSSPDPQALAGLVQNIDFTEPWSESTEHKR